MGVYLRGEWYWFKRMIEGRVYYRPLQIKRGQESLLSARAKQVEDKIIAQHLGLPVPVSGSIRFSEYAEKYLERKKQNKTVERDRQRLEIVKELWPGLPLGQYTPTHVRELEQKLFAREPALKPVTVNRYMELLQNLWNCAIEDREVAENPLKSYQPFAEDGTRRALLDSEISQILEAARSMREHPKAKIDRFMFDIILLSLATGMRLGMILNLRKDQIQGDTIVIPITQTKSKRRGISKDVKSKVIVLSKMAEEIIGRQKSFDEFVFPLVGGNGGDAKNGKGGVGWKALSLELPLLFRSLSAV
jgi:integrase